MQPSTDFLKNSYSKFPSRKPYMKKLFFSKIADGIIATSLKKVLPGLNACIKNIVGILIS